MERVLETHFPTWPTRVKRTVNHTYHLVFSALAHAGRVFVKESFDKSLHQVYMVDEFKTIHGFLRPGG